MNLTGLLAAVRAVPEYQSVRDALAQPHAPGNLALQLQRSARIPVGAALAHDLDRPTLYIAGRIDRAATVLEELAAWAPAARILLFPEPNPLFYEYAAWGPRTIYNRLAVLEALTYPAGAPGRPLIVVASARALMSRTMPQRDFLANQRTLKVGEPVRVEKLLESWVGAGYTPASIVVEPGQFARRGGILDIFPAASEQPVRLELFGEELETLRRFDPASQRSGERLERITIGPAHEALPRLWNPAWRVEPEEPDAPADGEEPIIPNLEFYLPRMFAPASLLEYLPEQALVLANVRNTIISYPMPAALANSTWTNALDGSSITLGSQVSLPAFGYVVLKK